MKRIDYLTRILPGLPFYAATRQGWLRKMPVNPLSLSYTVTPACQSRCKTCNIGQIYLKNPEIVKHNLTLKEIEKTFSSLGPVYVFNVSGGEPFMRRDLAEIIRLACIHLKPGLIHIPTNALASSVIEKTTRKILSYMDEYLPSSVQISIKPSIDGIGHVHDDIRGVKGNFKALEKTLDILLKMRQSHQRLHVDLGTVISRYNIDYLDEIENWALKRGIESYLHEIAQERAEFHNLGDSIATPVDVCESLIRRFKNKIIASSKGKASFTHTTEAVRMVYYDLAIRILKEHRQVIPCFAGISNIHLNYNGQVWPCCVLGDRQALGNIRDWDYDMKSLLCSGQSKKVRKYIADGNCACSMSDQSLSNILLSPWYMAKVLHKLVIFHRANYK